MTDFCFVNVSFGDRYVRTQERLKDSILKIYPDAAMFFWIDELPPGAKPFQQSLYGFKVHAINHARVNGFKKIIWIDTCAVLKGKVEPLFESGFIAVRDENKLSKHSHPWKVDPEWHLVGGSLYLFDFNQFTNQMVFDSWESMERIGFFGTQRMIMEEKNDGIERCGWRMDETCMAYALYNLGQKPHTRTLYDQVIDKQHFLNEGDKWYQTLK
jgi:hypothetical protein